MNPPAMAKEDCAVTLHPISGLGAECPVTMIRDLWTSFISIQGQLAAKLMRAMDPLSHMRATIERPQLVNEVIGT
jgi:hypothetical protein